MLVVVMLAMGAPLGVSLADPNDIAQGDLQTLGQRQGQPCWDLDGDGLPDLDEEDQNGDGLVNVDDCFGTTADTVTFLTAPRNIRLTCQERSLLVSDILPPGVPVDATGIITTITTFNDARDDHVVHTFGRNAAHGPVVWNSDVFLDNKYNNDVMITHNGELAGTDYYGFSHGTQIIPLKAGGTFDARLCNGHTIGTHYITMLVIGYFR